MSTQHESVEEKEHKRGKEPFDFAKFVKFYLHDTGSCQSLSPDESQGVQEQYRRRYYDHPEILTIKDFGDYLDEIETF